MADMMTRCKCGHTRRQHFEADETCGVVGCECCEFAPVPAAPAPGEIAGVCGAAYRYKTAHGIAERYCDEPFGHAGGHGCREPDGSHFGWSAAPAPEATREADDVQAAIIHDAEAEIRVLCRGDKRWRMSVPVRPDDSDEVFSALAKLARDLRATVAALSREIETLRAALPSTDLLARADGLLSLVGYRYRHQPLPEDVREDCRQASNLLRDVYNQLRAARAPEPAP